MLCPYCQQEMKPGYLCNYQQPIQWIPAEKRPALFKHCHSKHGVDLKECPNGSIMAYDAEAFYCEACRIVLAKTVKDD